LLIFVLQPLLYGKHKIKECQEELKQCVKNGKVNDNHHKLSLTAEILFGNFSL
jgi:hypothetical protein